MIVGCRNIRTEATKNRLYCKPVYDTRNVIQSEPLFPQSIGEEHAQFLESATYPQRSILEQLLTIS